MMENGAEIFPETADIETASEDYASRFAGEVGRYFLQVQADITLQLLQGSSGATVLDVGGGHCQLAQPLIDRGYKLTITGSDASCSKRAETLLAEGSYAYTTCNSLALPFDSQSFDAVLSFRLLPHVTDWQGIISELCRVSRGMVIVDYPDIRSFNALYRLLFHLKKSMEGNTRTYTLFNRRQIRQQFAASGFTDTDVRPEFFWPMVLHRVMNNPRLSRLIEAPARWTGLTSTFGSPIIACSSRSR